MTVTGSSSTTAPQHYRVVPNRSAVVIDVTTSLGPIAFGATGLEGFVAAAVQSAAVDLAVDPSAHLELQVRNLTSGNSAYDGELQRQIDARRFPAAFVDLHQVRPVGGTSPDYRVTGQVTFRGVAQPVEGLVTVDLPEPGVIMVRGEQVLDIRLFEIPPPALFMLKIDPDVTVSLQLEARVGS